MYPYNHCIVRMKETGREKQARKKNVEYEGGRMKRGGERGEYSDLAHFFF